MLFLGISVPSDGWHSSNEKVELDLLIKGVETAAYLWGDLAENWPRDALNGHASARTRRPPAVAR